MNTQRKEDRLLRIANTHTISSSLLEAWQRNSTNSVEKFKFHETQHLKDLMGGRASNHHIYLGTHWEQLGQSIKKKKKNPARSQSFFNSIIWSPALLKTTWKSSISHKKHSTVGKSSSTFPEITSRKPTSWWLWNWKTVDPESVSYHFFRSLSKKWESTNEVGVVSRNITLQEKISPEEPDHSKGPCRNLYRSSEMSSEDFERLQLLQEE